MNTLKVITGILFFLQCFTFTVLAESLPKFAMIISNCFSCGGAALSRHTFGETVQTVNWQFPHYFYRNFQKYNGKENTLPFDLYELITLLAPRPVYIANEPTLKENSYPEYILQYMSLYSGLPYSFRKT